MTVFRPLLLSGKNRHQRSKSTCSHRRWRISRSRQPVKRSRRSAAAAEGAILARNVKRWRDAGMALRWVAAGMIEANKGFRRLKAHKQLSVLRAALQAHHDRMTIKPVAHVTRAA